MERGLRTEAVRGAGWTALQKWIVRLSGLVVFVVLGRLLGPSQIGVAAAALAMTSLLSAPLELGVRSHLVRSGPTDGTRENTVFWIAVGLAGFGIGITCAVAGVIRDLHGTGQLWKVLLALSPILLLTAVEAVPCARLERALRFRSLAIREMVSAICAGIVGVVLALNGAGVWSLVAQALIQAFLSLVLVLKFARWRPRLVFSRRAGGEFVRFGGPLVGTQAIQLLHERGEQLLIGGVLGLDVLGVWAVVTRLLAAVQDLSISLLDIVAYPVFVRIHEDPRRLATAYRIAVSTCQGLLAPLLALVAVTAPVLVPVVFGPRWTAAIAPTQILCLGVAILGLAYLHRPVIRSVGKAGTELALVLANLILYFALLGLVVPYGLSAIALAIAGQAVVGVLLGSWVLVRRVGIRFPIPLASVVTMLCGGVAAACGLLVEDLSGRPTLGNAGAAAAVTVVVFVAGMLVFNRSVLISLKGDARRLVRRPA